MPFYSFEMILVGIILLSAMALGGVKLWLKRRHESITHVSLNDDPDQQNQDSSKPSDI